MCDLKTSNNVEVSAVTILHEFTVNGANEAKTLDTSDTPAGYSRGNVSIDWKFPKYPLTLIIKTGLTNLERPYQVFLKNDPRIQPFEVVEIRDGTEKDATPTDEGFVFDSDSNFSVTLKINPPTDSFYEAQVYYRCVEK